MPYSLEREPDSLDFKIVPDPGQITIFDYVGEEIDYASIRLESDPEPEVVKPEPVVYRDTGVPMGFRHWSQRTLFEKVQYKLARFWKWCIG